MTYEEKYSELLSQYEKAGKDLEEEIQKLSEIDGFGDIIEIEQYQKATNNFRYSENQFQRILRYVANGKIDPKTEFNTCEFIHGYIKNDQLEKGIELKDYEPYPNGEEEWKYYSCTISLTNSTKIAKEYRHSFYLFPVLNLQHGKECYAFMNDKLQNNPDEKIDVESLDFKKVIDEDKPIFLKISLGVE